MSSFAACCRETGTGRDQGLRKESWCQSSNFCADVDTQCPNEEPAFSIMGTTCSVKTDYLSSAGKILRLRIILTVFPLAFFFKKKKNSHLQSICWGIFNDLLNPKSLSRKELHLQRLKHCDPFSSFQISR